MDGVNSEVCGVDSVSPSHAPCLAQVGGAAVGHGRGRVPEPPDTHHTEGASRQVRYV